METPYVVNSVLKRIEPTYTQCTYCNNGIVSSIDDCYFIPLYNEQDRTNVIVYKSVKFQQITVGVTRCAACKKTHADANISGALKAALFFIPAIILCWFLFNAVGFIISFIVVFLAAFYLFGFFSDRQSYKLGVFPEVDGAKESPLVKAFLAEGWTIEKPSA
ncbi:hypothetical protein [Emticicia sp. 17c]|uniref:hypothetical protein n=1 Tax=Emticicia sp. 17c TaxID=3127704 RepID=UPI00301CE14B